MSAALFKVAAIEPIVRNGKQRRHLYLAVASTAAEAIERVRGEHQVVAGYTDDRFTAERLDRRSMPVAITYVDARKVITK